MDNNNNVALSSEVIKEDFNFSSRHSDNLPAILDALNISLAVTSYQSQQLILIRTQEGRLDTNLNTYPRPMGIYSDGQRITLGTLNQVIDFKRSDSILHKIRDGLLDDSSQLPSKLQERDSDSVQQYLARRAEQLDEIKNADALFVQRASLNTGMINIHDIAWGNEGLWVVNSTFSCLATLDPEYNFIARWIPPFITELQPEDRCHLNGMAMLDGEPRYVTTFNQANSQDSWQESPQLDGTLIDVKSGETLLTGLIMPHSPRCYAGQVYFCNSGTGEIQIYNPKNRQTRTLCKLPGFTRGITFVGELMLVCTSKLRASERAATIPLQTELPPGNSICGIWLLDPETGTQLANLQFTGDVEQIYDIAVIPHCRVPELARQEDALTRHLFEFRQEIRL
ncbi:TIGR03032 family protein [Shewanella sedimentimangrovi]|uniref:TIGR03032 family protein n=1 Tax=Shewanella sedimentimangrovi TaxID=2814293 RepID=A0ABX7R2K8_9GAMM|nr:TIGR03032 family protein [Shewanella sedimentimangrovi]QSX37420.1 TIGR03032 family protein [Shewanella sedimentimangrovi]